MAVFSFSFIKLGIEISPVLFSKVGPDLTKKIGDVVCYNQGKYIEFEFMLGNKHKTLKTSLYNNALPNEISEKYLDLVKYICEKTEYILEKNFYHIIECNKLIKKSIFPVRVCVKTGKEGKIIDVHRNERRLYVNEPHSIEKNTGFQSVFNSGTHYLCNDIPSQAKNGFYKNPRLQEHLVRSYELPKKKIFSKKEIIDIAWCNCWVRGEFTPPDWERSCYKSTMIIPMTLINNELDDKFKEHFSDNRTIIGFLCFDHPRINYFNEDIDVKLGYIFADILSLYFYSAYIHTTISQTFQKAKGLLENKEI